MRNLALWAALLLGAAHSGAQAPLSVDPSFAAPFEMVNGNQDVGVVDLVRLSDGNMLVSGGFLFPADWWNMHNDCVLGPSGDLISNNFYGSYCGGAYMADWNNMIYIGSSNVWLRRFQQDGTQDTSYHHCGSGDADLLQGAEYLVMYDGSILQVGAIQWPNEAGAPIYGLMKFTNTGAVDTTYEHRLSNGNIYTLRETGDGRYWCSGVLNNYDGHPVSRFFRIWPNGDLDTTFNSPITAGYVRGIHTMANGKLIVAGGFVVSSVTDTLYVVRLNPDGSLDNTFNNNLHLEWFNDSLMALVPGVADMIALDSAHLMIGGAFWTIDGERRGAIAVIDTAGNLDPVLCNYYGCDSISGGPNNDRAYGAVGHLEIMDDGMIYVCGNFTGFDDGTWHPEQGKITRLYPLSVGVPENDARSANLRLFPNPGETGFRIETDVEPEGIMVRDVLGKVVLSSADRLLMKEVNAHGWPPGCYAVEVVLSKGVRRTNKWIKQ